MSDGYYITLQYIAGPHGSNEETQASYDVASFTEGTVEIACEDYDGSAAFTFETLDEFEAFVNKCRDLLTAARKAE